VLTFLSCPPSSQAHDDLFVAVPGGPSPGLVLGEATSFLTIKTCLVYLCAQGIPCLPELKLRYYELMIVYHQHYHNYLEICRCYKAIYESDGVQADAAQWQPVRTGPGWDHTAAAPALVLAVVLSVSVCLLALHDTQDVAHVGACSRRQGSVLVCCVVALLT
jgi:hypothetical protein